MRGALVTTFFFLGLATAANAAAPAVKAVSIQQKTHAYALTIKYPQTGNPKIDAEIAAWAKKQAADFVAYVKTDRQGDDDGGQWTLDVACKVARSDASMLEILCKHQSMDDGNHTHVEFTSFNYMMPDAHRVFIAEIVVPTAFAKMRAFAAAHMTSEDPDFDAAVADDKALPPVEDSFAAFVVSPTAITVYFTPEQLGDLTSAGGHSAIPLTELKGLMRADWRAPAPSFDCAKAATPVEKAICADVALSRTDRAMAAAYREWIVLADNKADVIAQHRADQQTWLAARAKACPGAAGPAMSACLNKLYQARIKVLRTP